MELPVPSAAAADSCFSPSSHSGDGCQRGSLLEWVTGATVVIEQNAASCATSVCRADFNGTHPLDVQGGRDIFRGDRGRAGVPSDLPYKPSAAAERWRRSDARHAAGILGIITVGRTHSSPLQAMWRWEPLDRAVFCRSQLDSNPAAIARSCETKLVVLRKTEDERSRLC